jgi:hypothetical protein
MIDCPTDFRRLQLAIAIITGTVAWLIAPGMLAHAQQQLAIVSDDRINECSGLACSRSFPGAVWMHNDSGDKPRLFLVGADGETETVCHLSDANAVDWEDMSSFNVDNQSWLLVADVGDNQARRTKSKSPCTLYVLNEPTPGEKQELATQPCIRIRFEYEDGPHNCEGVAVDAVRREVLLLTKESPLTTAIYRMPLDVQQKEQQLVARQIARLPLAFATGLDISPDGRTLAAVTMWDGWICQRKSDQSWDDALHQTISRIAMPQRRQGEAVCFTADGRYLLLSSEHRKQPLWRLDLSSTFPRDP